MLNSLLRRNRVPVARNLDAVTTRDSVSEADPATVDMTQGQVDEIWSRVVCFYRTGLQPAISLTLRRKGKIVINRSIGHSRISDGRNAGVLCTPDTPLCLFSASKAITAMLVHKLVELRQLTLDDRIARFIPEYAAEGKGATTVRHLLAHRAGIPRVPDGTPPELLFDWHAAVALLCASKPVTKSGEAQSYHAISGGFILGELAQRVSGTSLSELLRDVIVAPMGLKHMTFGLPENQRENVALNYFTGPHPIFPMTTYIERILSASFEKVVEVSNLPGFLTSVIPAGNIYATADDTGAFFQMLMQDGQWNGKAIFKKATVAEAVRPAGPIHFDWTLLLPVRFSTGFVLGEWPAGLYGGDCRSAYGHLGFLNTICWADPDRDISVGFINTGKTLSVDQLAPMVGILGSISACCKKVPRRVRSSKH